MSDPDDIGRLEQRLGAVLTTGTLLSAIALTLGLLVWLAMPGRPESAWLLRAGLFALMATPVLRVFVSLAGYLRMGDWAFAAITAAVIAELGLALLSALRR